MAAPISLRGLVRRFAGSDRAAVDHLDLEVEEGETVCLVGPSGCGKSTTLRLVAGLDVPDKGTIHIGGRDMRGVPPQDRDVAMVFQGFALYPHMRVRQILSFPLKMRGVPRAHRTRAVDRVSELLGIAHLLDRRPAELSGGEQQRVAMGRAIVREPRVFLFDEPLSNLDAALRTELRVELGRLLRRLNTTALYVTHDQAEAMTLADRIAVLRDGRLEQVAPPRTIYERPASSFVGRFFGVPPMNLLEASCSDGQARCASLRFPAPERAPEKLLLGIRPEHVRITQQPTPQGDATASARVTALEPHGAETHVELEFDAQPLRVRMTGFDTPGIGESVQVALDADKIRWFCADTGQAW
jgi:multiple sugar transport system ATP-binding protein